MRASRAFTLIELLVVISIIALLSSVVLGSLNAAREKARMASIRQFAAQTYRAAGEAAEGVWDFDEGSGTTAADRSLLARTATLGGGAAWTSDTPSGQGSAVLLDGSDDYIQVADSGADLDFPGNAPFSVSFWVKFKSFSTTNYVRLISKEATSGGRQGWDVLWVYPNQRISFERWRDNSANSAFGGTYALDTWYHIAATYDGSIMYLYKDGQVVGSSGSSLSLIDHNQPLRFGAFSGGGSGSNIVIDEARVFSKHLTVAEIGRLYAEGSRLERTASR